ncbi:MAG: FKBP-type peptidyl-prolyl cis-trans isomerase [Cyclobacteriaceae bacterium]|nr:FKBP-type peptidyl-prolyl cis-trans isomerase [Cyclobacteriaceae bacterium]
MTRVLIVTAIILCATSCATKKIVHSDSGLKYMVLKKGKGEVAKVGNEVLIHEKMSYQNDSLLFSSYNLPSPIKFLVGGNQVIDGVDKGVRGMKRGEIRKLIVPPSLSKRMGNQTFPHPDSTLVYEVELIDILAKD